MTLRKHCSAWLGLAGACLLLIGCGSDVPDPGSDANAATGNVPGGGGGEPPAPAAAPAPEVAAAEEPKAQEAAPAPAPAEAPKDQPKGQGGSTTSEMLAMAGGSSPAPAGGSETPNPASGAPPGAPAAGGGPPAGVGPGAGMMGPGAGGGAPRMGPGSPGMGQQGMDPGKMAAQMQGNMQAQMKAQGLVKQQPGLGGAGAGPGNNKVAEGPADLHSPTGAVKTFLDALKAKDVDRLSEATARRAAVESATKNQDMFSKIIEVSLSDSELDDLARKLEGYQISGENPPKSTGRVDVVIQKSEGNGSYSRRRVTARREKKGWGVLDISPEQVFKALGARRVTKSR